MWGFCTVLNDVLVPYLKAVFGMDYVQTMLIQLSFFGAYLLLALPAAELVGRLGYKTAIVAGLAIMAIGCLTFIPAAKIPSYELFLLALFGLACGMTILQVAANPYMAIIGSPKTSAARLNLAQGFNSVGTLLAPLFGSLFILKNAHAGLVAADTVLTSSERAADAQIVQIPYLGIAIVLLVLAIIVHRARLVTTRMPHVDRGNMGPLIANRMLLMGILAIFVYVGGEVSIGSFLISYMASSHIGQLSTADAAGYLSFYWGGAALGRFIGALALRFIPPSKMLADNCVAAVFLLLLSMAARGPLAMWSVILVGLCNSIMFPTIFALAIRGLGTLTGRGSALLVMAISGGAVVPMLQAVLADQLGITISFCVPLFCYVLVWLFAMRNYDGHGIERPLPAS
jgi:FHS family L-fucose permease-like MFS transporter